MKDTLGESSRKFDNAVIFIADSLRFDSVPWHIERKGTTLKTIAQSVYTAPAIPSILTGLYPANHGVHDFSNSLEAPPPRILDGLESGVCLDTVWTHIPDAEDKLIYRVLNLERHHLKSLDEVEPPFLYVEHHKGGHAPYGPPRGEWGSVKEFFEEYRDRPDEIRVLYEEGAGAAKERLEGIIHSLETRGILERTLIIFTSDHGELLGEYGGLYGHGHPLCPELVYTPTTFIGEGIPTGLKTGVMRQIDILPTIIDALDLKHSKMDGRSLWGKTPSRNARGFCTVSRGDKVRYAAKSMWNGDGGHVLHTNGTLNRLAFLTHRNLTAGPESPIIRRNLPIQGLYQTYIKKMVTYGTPGMGEEEAVKAIESQKLYVVREEITDELREDLKQWGYL